MAPSRVLTSSEKVKKAIQLQEPDRIPVIVTATAFESRYSGYKFSQCLFSPDILASTVIKVTEDFDLDAAFTS